MFFSWLIKNKHFKKGSDIGGQITPLLIVVMVILLIAALTPINVGRIALDKTYSSNSSDAGALAAASEYDAAFNELARQMTLSTDDAASPGGLNYRLYMNFVASHRAYEIIYNDACDNIIAAIAEALAGDVLFIAAWDVLTGTPSYGQVYTDAIIATALAAASAALVWESAQQTEEFYLRAQYMLSITESFHDGQWDFYKSIRDFMDDSHTSSIDLGYSYAFSNSGITQKLSVAQENAYSAWISSTDKQYLSGIYQWTDQLTKNHKVEVNVNVPWIVSYDLQHTRDSYSDIKDHLDTIISRAPLIVSALTATYSSISTYGALCVILFTLSVIDAIFADICDACSCPGCCGCCAFCAPALTIWLSAEVPLWNNLFAGWGPVIMAWLAGLLAVAGAVCLYLLQSENDDAFNGWKTDEPNIHVYTNSRLAPPYAKGAFNDTVAKDLMIVSIYDVIMESWNITVSSKQTHPGTAQGIIPTTYPIVQSSTVVDFYGPPYSGGNHDSVLKIWNFEDYQFNSKITTIY